KQQILDLYCISPSLIPQPKDWAPHHQITGFINIPQEKRAQHALDQTPVELTNWLQNGTKPIYMGFGSNGVGNPEKVAQIVSKILEQTNERILFCTGWSLFENLPKHPNLYVTKYINHESILPQCKTGIFHGGAGTLATMLRCNLPVIIVSFYTDQPTWGKIVERRRLGRHIPFKKLTTAKLLSALNDCQSSEIRQNIENAGQVIRAENGLKNAVSAIEHYFSTSMI
ncbi:MAG: glycosyltransferase family 1 protein, partial [Saprospiraceae bacterium]|nr:glycosyltransferase family 1 protein [Saprospiraceae bacterium]